MMPPFFFLRQDFALEPMPGYDASFYLHALLEKLFLCSINLCMCSISLFLTFPFVYFFLLLLKSIYAGIWTPVLVVFSGMP